jgi:AcrR family transcriptional regulator
MKATTRISKEERRREIVEAATREFAAGGLHGTPVEAIARRVGVSQPYLFQLFGTKKQLFIAALRRGYERTRATFVAAANEAAPGSTPWDKLMVMGSAYEQLLQDRTLLLMQLQGYVACEDPEVREIVRGEFVRLVQEVKAASGAQDEELRFWLAEGMLMNVAAAIELGSIHQSWADLCAGWMDAGTSNGSGG